MLNLEDTKYLKKKKILNKKTNYIALIIIVLLITITIFGKNNAYIDNSKTKVYFLSEVIKDVGSADCILLENINEKNEKQYGLIDVGTSKTQEKVKMYLKDKGIEKLYFVIITHPDSDHIGAMLDIMDNIKIENICIKGRPEDDTVDDFEFEKYDAVIEKAKEKKINIINPKEGDSSLTFGTANLTFHNYRTETDARVWRRGTYKRC